MRTELWVTIFLIIFGALFLPFHYRIAHIASGIKSNEDMERNLFSACLDAVGTLDPSGEDVFGSRDDRRKSVEAFYDTLASAMNFGYVADGSNEANGFQERDAREAVKYYVPCIVMVDWDGYYIGYTKTFGAADGSIRQSDVVTERYSFSQERSTRDDSMDAPLTVGGKPAHITYSLDSKVRVDLASSAADRKPEMYEGNYVKVFQDMCEAHSGSNYAAMDQLAKEWFHYTAKEGQAAKATGGSIAGLDTALKVMEAIKEGKIAEKDVYFRRRRDSVVSRDLEYQIGYYINLHNEYYNSMESDYVFTMPQIPDKEFH